MTEWRDTFTMSYIDSSSPFREESDTERAIPLSEISVIGQNKNTYWLKTARGRYAEKKNTDGLAAYDELHAMLAAAKYELLEPPAKTSSKPARRTFILNQMAGLIITDSSFEHAVSVSLYSPDSSRYSFDLRRLTVPENKAMLAERFYGATNVLAPVARTSLYQHNELTTTEILIRPYYLDRMTSCDGTLSLHFPQLVETVQAVCDDTVWQADTLAAKTLRASFGPDEQHGFNKWAMPQNIDMIERAMQDILAVRPALPVRRYGYWWKALQQDHCSP